MNESLHKRRRPNSGLEGLDLRHHRHQHYDFQDPKAFPFQSSLDEDPNLTSHRDSSHSGSLLSHGSDSSVTPIVKEDEEDFLLQQLGEVDSPFSPSSSVVTPFSTTEANFIVYNNLQQQQETVSVQGKNSREELENSIDKWKYSSTVTFTPEETPNEKLVSYNKHQNESTFRSRPFYYPSGLTLWRESLIGQSLIEALSDLVCDQIISSDESRYILEIFDETITKNLSKLTPFTHFKIVSGWISQYKNLDGSWVFYIADFRAQDRCRTFGSPLIRVIATENDAIKRSLNELQRKRKKRETTKTAQELFG